MLEGGRISCSMHGWEKTLTYGDLMVIKGIVKRAEPCKRDIHLV